MIQTVVYWGSTGLLSALYIVSASLYITRTQWAREALVELGYPGYLVPFMIAIKLLAVLAIVSRFNLGLSDLAYAGIFYHLVLSGLAHLGAGKPRGAVPALLGLVLLSASFMSQNLVRDVPSPYAPTVTASLNTL